MTWYVIWIYQNKQLRSEPLGSMKNRYFIAKQRFRISEKETNISSLSFKEEKQLIYCDNVPGLFGQLGISSYNPEEWRLFMNSSKRNLKCVLLHNGNGYGAVPISHSTVVLKEQQQDIRTVMNLLKYHEHYWIICVDLKMVSLLLGQQKGYTEYSCFLCMWDSRDGERHWIQKEWPKRDTLERGMPNVIHNPIVSRDKIIFPPLHIKLGLMKQFVKALSVDGECFEHLICTFPAYHTKKSKLEYLMDLRYEPLCVIKVLLKL